MAKVKIVMEIEFSELPDDVRDELADGLNFRDEEDHEIASDLDTVPTASSMSDRDVEAALIDFFDGLSHYEMQAELWAGSDVYGYISAISVQSVEPAEGRS